jgi:hypothetical protein
MKLTQKLSLKFKALDGKLKKIVGVVWLLSLQQGLKEFK